MIFNSLPPEGYPEGYHLGPSLVLWLILIALQMFYGTFLLLQAYKSHLINEKEIYRGTGFLCVGGGFLFLLMQIGVFMPEDYFLYYFGGCIVLLALATFYFYYWEKNLVNLKKIPTLIILINFSIYIITFLIILLFRVSPIVFISLIEMLTIFSGLLANCFIIIFVFLFTRRVKGTLRKKSILLIIGSSSFFLGQFIDHPPGMFLFPSLFILLSPLVFMISFSFIFFGINGIADNVSSYYNQAHICLVHRGKITAERSIYYCPKCSTIYCQDCYEQVVRHDGCWNCGERGKDMSKVKSEERLKDEEIIVKDGSKETPKKINNHKL